LASPRRCAVKTKKRKTPGVRTDILAFGSPPRLDSGVANPNHEGIEAPSALQCCRQRSNASPLQDLGRQPFCSSTRRARRRRIRRRTQFPWFGPKSFPREKLKKRVCCKKGKKVNRRPPLLLPASPLPPIALPAPPMGLCASSSDPKLPDTGTSSSAPGVGAADATAAAAASTGDKGEGKQQAAAKDGSSTRVKSLNNSNYNKTKGGSMLFNVSQHKMLGEDVSAEFVDEQHILSPSKPDWKVGKAIKRAPDLKDPAVIPIAIPESQGSSSPFLLPRPHFPLFFRSPTTWRAKLR